MSCPLLSLPLDFELCDPVRRLSILLESPDAALTVAFRLWVDWGRSGKEWRVMDCHDVHERDWSKETLVRLLEASSRRVILKQGELIQQCVAAGLIFVERRGDMDGLVLANFWEHNRHLSPLHKTMQQRGGAAKAKLAQMRDSEGLAIKQVKLLEARQPDLPLVSGQRATAEERKAAVVVIMRLDIACNRPVRITSEYEKSIIAAVDVVRKHTFADVDLVCRYLIAHDEDAFDPDHVLLAFGDYLCKTQ